MSSNVKPGDTTQSLLDEQLDTIRAFRKQAEKQRQTTDAGLDTFARLAGFELDFEGDELVGFKPTDRFLQERESRERLTDTATSRLQDILEGRVEDPRAVTLADRLRDSAQARIEAQYGPQNLGSTGAQEAQSLADIDRENAIFGAGLTLQQLFENTRRGLVGERLSARGQSAGLIGAGIGLGQQATQNFASIPGLYQPQIETSAAFDLQPSPLEKAGAAGLEFGGKLLGGRLSRTPPTDPAVLASIFGGSRGTGPNRPAGSSLRDSGIGLGFGVT
jgi:hypothetical protein